MDSNFNERPFRLCSWLDRVPTGVDFRRLARSTGQLIPGIVIYFNYIDLVLQSCILIFIFQHKVAIGTSICMIVLGVLEAGLSIWGSVICCKTICCGASEQAAGVCETTDNKNNQDKLLFLRLLY